MNVLGQVDLASLMAELADRAAPRSEAYVQSGIRSLLLYGGLNLDDLHVRRLGGTDVIHRASVSSAERFRRVIQTHR